MSQEVLRKPVHTESKKIAKVSPAMHGHLAIEFEDHEKHMLVAGDYYPPLPSDLSSVVGTVVGIEVAEETQVASFVSEVVTVATEVLSGKPAEDVAASAEVADGN